MIDQDVALQLYTLGIVTLFYIPIAYVALRRWVRRSNLRRFADGVHSIMRSLASRSSVIEDSIVRIEIFFSRNDFARGHESIVDLMERIFSAAHSRRKTRTLKKWQEEDEHLFDSVLMAMKDRHPFASLSGEFQNLLRTLKEEVGDREAPALIVEQLGEKIRSLEAGLRRQRTYNLVATVISAVGVVFSVVGFLT